MLWRWKKRVLPEIPPLHNPEWEVSAPADMVAFMKHLSGLLPEGSVLVLEATSIARDVKSFLEAHQPANRPTLHVETTWPKSKVFHVPVTQMNMNMLAELVENHALPEICDHLKAYKGVREILAWYDVCCDDPWFVDACIGEAPLRSFCETLGCTYKKLG